MQCFHCIFAGVTEEELDRVFKALGDPTRRRIIDALAERPRQSLFELCAAAVAADGTVLSRQAVTQHLDLLERAGVVRVEWSGRTKLHSLDLAPLRAAMGSWLGRHL